MVALSVCLLSISVHSFHRPTTHTYCERLNLKFFSLKGVVLT